MPREAFPIIQTGTSALSMERDQSFIPASGIDVTPAYLEEQSKSAVVSNTERGGGASDKGKHRNEASAQ